MDHPSYNLCNKLFCFIFNAELCYVKTLHKLDCTKEDVQDGGQIQIVASFSCCGETLSINTVAKSVLIKKKKKYIHYNGCINAGMQTDLHDLTCSMLLL